MSFKLRPYQEQAVSQVMEDLEKYQKVALILPTGAGKTECFIEIAKRHSGGVLALSHLSILTSQTLSRFALRAPEIRTGILQANIRPHILSKVIVGTMQTSRDKGKADFLKVRLIREPSLIIVDEAHHILTDSYQKVMNYFPNAKVIGVTATPFRSNQIMTNFFDKISYSMSLQELIDSGYLVPPKLFPLERSGSELEDIIGDVVRTYEERENGKGSIVFMKTMKDAKTLRNVFVDRGISCEAITSNVTGEVRDQIIERFNNGDIKVLTSCNVLTAGFDSPRVSSIFMPYPVRSATAFAQRIGRGLRKYDEGRKQYCSVYCFGDTPSVSRKLYQKVQNLALNQGGKIKEYDTVLETLEYNEWDEQDPRYRWTKTEAEIVNRMEKVGMSHFSQMLNERRFPKRFLENITDLLNRLPRSKSSLPNGKQPVTMNQKGILYKYGFKPEDIKYVTKGEASQMISTIMGNRNTKWEVKTGRYAGKNVFELPFSYRDYILKNMPNSEVGQLIQAWRNRNVTLDGSSSTKNNKTTTSRRVR